MPLSKYERPLSVVVAAFFKRSRMCFGSGAAAIAEPSSKAVGRVMVASERTEGEQTGNESR